MRNVASVAGAMIAAGSTSGALADTVYSTRFEAPEFTQGALGSQGGWSFAFGTDPVVTSAFSKTGDQSLVVSGTDTAFGQNSLTGTFSTAAPQVSPPSVIRWCVSGIARV